MENREFFEYFFDQQVKANGIEQLKKLRSIILQVQPNLATELAAQSIAPPETKRRTKSIDMSAMTIQDAGGPTLSGTPAPTNLPSSSAAPVDSLNLTQLSNFCDFTNREKAQILGKIT